MSAIEGNSSLLSMNSIRRDEHRKGLEKHPPCLTYLREVPCGKPQPLPKAERTIAHNSWQQSIDEPALELGASARKLSYWLHLSIQSWLIDDKTQLPAIHTFCNDNVNSLRGCNRKNLTVKENRGRSQP